MMISVLPPPMSITMPLAGLAGKIVRDARIDQARFLHAGDDLDRKSERLAGALEKSLFAPCDTQRVGADDTDVARIDVAQSLPKTLQARQRPGCRILVESAIVADAGGQTHHLAQAVDDDQLPVRVPRHHHMKTVGTEVDGRNDLDGRGSAAIHSTALDPAAPTGRSASAVRQAVKEEPHPQVV